MGVSANVWVKRVKNVGRWTETYHSMRLDTGLSSHRVKIVERSGVAPAYAHMVRFGHVTAAVDDCIVARSDRGGKWAGSDDAFVAATSFRTVVEAMAAVVTALDKLAADAKLVLADLAGWGRQLAPTQEVDE